MKLLEFIVILGIFWKGHYVSAIKLSSNYRNRKLLVKEGTADTATKFVYFSEKCSVTRISADKIASDTKCGDTIEFCPEPKDSKCEKPTKAAGGKDSNGVSVFVSPGTDAPETTAEFKECLAVGFAIDEGKTGTKSSATVDIKVEGDALTVTATKGEICPSDNGGAIVCGGKLAGVFFGVAEKCGAAAKGLKVGALLSAAGGDGSEAPGSEDKDTSTTKPTVSGSYTITPSLAITTLPIIIITYLDH